MSRRWQKCDNSRGSLRSFPLYDAGKYLWFTPSDHTCPLLILDKRRLYLWIKPFISHRGCFYPTIFVLGKVIWMTSWLLIIQNRFHFDMGRWTPCASIYSVLLKLWPFYSFLLSCLAFEWKWGWRWPCFDRNLPPFLMLMMLSSC